MGRIITTTYELMDISIVPSTVTTLRSRSEADITCETCGRKTLPIFVAPMPDVTDENNYQTWIDNNVTPVIPRSVYPKDYNERLKFANKTFVSLSLEEARNFSLNNPEINDTIYICVDMANGHISDLLNVCKLIKKTYYYKVVIMAGNIANPNTYIDYCEAGIDYVRCGIGGGSRCTTTNAVGVHYGMATLLSDIVFRKLVRQQNKQFCTKIIADGGINWYDSINKALALGVDYVMMGKMFAECEEACGDIIRQTIYGKKYRNYAGASHRSNQKKLGGDGSKVSEGITKEVEVKYPVSHLIENISAYLRSAMSYTDSRTLSQFAHNAQLVVLGGSGDLSTRK